MIQISRTISFSLCMLPCLFFNFLFAGITIDGNVKIKELRCEYTVNPLGIDTKTPKFSWMLESNEREQMQSAYQVLVATYIEKLKKGIGDKWDSKKVRLSNSVNIPYKGKPLTSGEKCYWKVRIWDKKGKPSDLSAPATFEMGLLQKDDWQGKWIGTRLFNESILFRRKSRSGSFIKG